MKNWKRNLQKQECFGSLKSHVQIIEEKKKKKDTLLSLNDACCKHLRQKRGVNQNYAIIPGRAMIIHTWVNRRISEKNWLKILGWASIQRLPPSSPNQIHGPVCAPLCYRIQCKSSVIQTLSIIFKKFLCFLWVN